jgi:hypothetical protein
LLQAGQFCTCTAEAPRPTPSPVKWLACGINNPYLALRFKKQYSYAYIIIMIIIIILGFSFMQGIYTHIPEILEKPETSKD